MRCWPTLNDFASIHYQNIIGDGAYHRQIMADEQIGEPQPVAQIGQKVQHLSTDGNIERGNRFIGDDQFWFGDQRPGNGDALALIIEPPLIILDEAVSALDVSIRAQILDLLAELSDRLGIAYLFISHDLSVVRAITDRVLVMKDGVFVEEGISEEVFSNPKHPYTKQLITAVPDIEKALVAREQRK